MLALVRSSRFVVVAAAILALGAGATVAASAYLQYLTRPRIEAPAADELHFVNRVTEHDPRDGLSEPDFRDLREARAFSALAGWRFFSTTLGAQDGETHAWGHAVSGDYFTLFGAVPLRGRLLLPSDDVAGAAPVVVLGHHFWQRRFGGDPQILGRAVTLEGNSAATVVGITSPGFQGEGVGTSLYVPLAAASWLAGRQDRDASTLTVLGRRARGTAASEVAARLAGVAAALQARSARSEPLQLALADPQETLAREASDPSVLAARVVMAVAGVLFVVGCVNVALLMLARATARRREWAVRLALGATPARLMTTALIETILIAATTIALSLPVAGTLIGVIESYLLSATPFGLGDWSESSHLTIDWQAAAAQAFALGGVGAFLCWAGSAAPLRGRRFAEDLRTVASGSAPSPLRRRLVIVQVALAVALVCVAAVVVGSLQRLARQPLGLELRDRIAALVHRPAASAVSDEALRYLDEVRQLSGVETAALVSRGPMNSSLPLGETQAGTGHVVTATVNHVTEDYLAVLGVPRLAGRDFSPQDATGSPMVAAVSERLAIAQWGSPQEALGKPLHLRLRGRTEPVTVQVIGVAADSRQAALTGEMLPHVYLALRQWPAVRPTLIVHTTAPVAEPMARLLRDRHAGSSIIDLRPLSAQRDGTLGDLRMSAEIVGGFALWGLMLAVLGLYGLMMYLVTLRARELGIRLALGATGSRIRAEVIFDALRLMGSGFALGLAGAVPLWLLVSRWIPMPRLEVVSVAAALTTFLAAGLCGAYGPARRAARVDPAVALAE